MGDIGVSVPPHQTRTTTQRRKGKEARLSAKGTLPVPHGVLETTARNRRILSFQAAALIRLIDDLLKGDTQSVEVDAALFPDLRLPGDNPDDALRYLLRGLRAELRAFDEGLAAMAGDAGGLGPALGPLRQLALAVAQVFAQVFAAAPDSGAGHAMLSMIGNILDQSGLMAWRDFLGRFGGAHAEPWAEVAFGAGNAPDAPGPRPQQTARPQPAAADHPQAPAVAATAAEAAGPTAVPAPSAGAPPAARQTAEPAAKSGPEPAKAPARRIEPAAGTEDPLEIPLILVRPDHGDWARVLFKRGLAYLTKVYGEPPEKLRPLLGNWVAQSGDDHQKVFRLLAKAQSQREPDPKGWVSKILTESGGAPSPA
ncbi:MAG: hypothetical protein OEO83_10700 [Alphaproteobacteria bacterium]|nr:hypothetical protein [Alphaproteobacteria bacterium]